MIDLIKAATLINNPQLQKIAENTILKQRVEHPQQFFLQNAQILQSQEIPIAIRQSAGTLLTVSLKQKIEQTFLWDRLSPAANSSIKDMVLSAMIDPEKIVRRAAANIVAAICCMEIPQKKWPGIVQKITSNMSHETPIIKQVSILTIGFICQQLKQFNFEFDNPLQQAILTGILVGIKDTHNQISQTAFKALRDGISSVSAVIKNPQYREFLITQIAEAINTKRYVQYALQCLIQFIKNYFSYMEARYIEGFANLLHPYLTNPKEQAECILAMEFWTNFARQEKNIQQNPSQVRFLVGNIADRLVQGLLQNLCEVEEGQQEENGISDSASSALQAIFQGDSVQYKVKVLAFTSNAINHENWKYRQGSIRAFALLLMGLPEQVSQNLVNASLLNLVKLLNDKAYYVQASAIKSLSLISQQTGNVILHHGHFIEILQLIVEKTAVNEVFMRYGCKIIDNLCIVPDSIGSLGPISDQLIKVFLDASLQPNRSASSINNCLCTILSLITNSENAAICIKYIDYVLANFVKISGLNSQKKDTFYSGFFTIAQVCLLTIRKAGGSITMDQMSKLYDLVINYFIQINNVEGDGFYVVSALAFFVPNQLSLVQDFWKYIQYGLQKYDQFQVFRATISCICDFATVYQNRIVGKVGSIFNELYDTFEKNIVSRDLKLDILMCFGELFLQCGQGCSNQVKRVMDIILLSIEGVFHIADINYAEVLQESIIQTLTCIYHGLNGQKIHPQLASYVQYIFRFINLTTDKSRRPKLDYVKIAMILLADIASFYPNECRSIIQPDFIRDRLATLNKYNNDGHLTKDIKYIRTQFGV